MRLARRLSFESMESRRLLAVVDIPDNLRGLPQQQVASPVNIDNASGVRAAEITLKYDPTILDISAAQIVKGSVWGTDANVQLVANVDAANGLITVSVFGANGLPTGSGSLVNFNFTVRAGATLGSTTALDLREVRLNEGTITVTPAPQTGVDGTDGVITIGESTGGNNTISGRVYADVNLNNAPDTTEGIPAVTITLINTATNSQTTVTTSASGEFQFTNVAAGSYRIQQKQPAAFINGGANEITVTTTGPALTGQNFREIGLRPEYVYNRLFTTLVMPIGSTAWTNTITQIVTDAETAAAQATQSSITSSNSSNDESTAPSLASSVTDAAPDSSAGEFTETVTTSDVPATAGESVDEDVANAALFADPDALTDSDSNEPVANDVDETIPPANQDELLLALLAAEDSGADSSADELLGA